MKRNTLELIGVVFVVLFFIAFVVGFIGVLLKPDSYRNFYEGVKGIKVISIKGPIISGEPSVFTGKDKIETIIQSIRKASKNSNVLGVVFRINSPGGSVGAVQEIYREALRLKKKKPIVVSIEDIAASGGYYIASVGKPIFVNKGSLIGSIGVIVISFSAKDLLNKLGIKVNVIKSGKFKDMLFWGRNITPDEKKYIQRLVDRSYRQFLKDVADARGMDVDKLKKYADGRVFSGDIGVKIGLADKYGNYYDAIEYLWKDILKRRGEPKIISSEEDTLEMLIERLSNRFFGGVEDRFSSVMYNKLFYLYIE